MKPARFSNEDQFAWNKNNGYVDNLIKLFEGCPNVLKAYFGLNHTPNGSSEFFLAVEQDDDSNEVQRMAEKVAEIYSPGMKVFYTSNCYEADWMEQIIPYNFAFYVKAQPRQLSMTIMKAWLEPDLYQDDLINLLRTCKPISLLKDYNPLEERIYFQTYVRNGREFIPLFSEKEMVYKSGMTHVPRDLTVMEFEWRKVGHRLSGEPGETMFVLNPGTTFEIEFFA